MEPKQVIAAYKQLKKLLTWVHANSQNEAMREISQYLVVTIIGDEIRFWEEQVTEPKTDGDDGNA